MAKDAWIPVTTRDIASSRVTLAIGRGGRLEVDLSATPTGLVAAILLSAAVMIRSARR